MRQLVGGVWGPQTVISQTASIVTDSVLGITDCFCPYQVFSNGSAQQFVTGNVLFAWPSAGFTGGLWSLSIDRLGPASPVPDSIASSIAVELNNVTLAVPTLEIMSEGG